MSTAYRIGGQGNRLTKKKLTSMIKELQLDGWSIKKSKDKKNTDLILKTPRGYVHLYKTGKSAYNGFERFGLNSAIMFVGLLESSGYTVYSEHDERFWR